MLDVFRACLAIIEDVVLLYVKQIQLFSFQKVSWAMSLNSRWTDDSKFLLKFFKRFFLIGLFDNDLCLETQQQSQIVEKIPLWDRQILMTAMTFQLQLYKMNCSLLHVKRWHGELTTKNGFFVRLILKLGAHGFKIFPMGGWYQLERDSDLSKNYSYGYCLLKQKFNY